MKHLNERHTWFNLEKNEKCVLRYTTTDGSMIDAQCIEYLSSEENKVVSHKYGIIVFEKPLMYLFSCGFISCKKLKSVIIPDCVQIIYDNVFLGCSELETVTIPTSVISMGEGAFWNCNKLTIYYEGTADEFKNIQQEWATLQSNTKVVCSDKTLY